MSEPFVGEIRAFAGNFAPRGWFLCAGQQLPIGNYQALYAVIGTFYGGDGIQSFKLPDLRGRCIVGAGQGLGLEPVEIGEMAGQQEMTLLSSQLPNHTHTAVFNPVRGGGNGGGGGETPLQVSVKIGVTSTTGTLPGPAGNVLAVSPTSGPGQASIYAPSTATLDGALAGVSATVSGGGGGGGGGITGGTVTVNPSGGSLPFDIMPPYTGINYIIAFNGIFPTRS